LLFIFWFKEKKEIFFEKNEALKKIIWNNKFFLLFFILLFLSITVSKNPMAGWYGAVKLIEFVFFAYYTSSFVSKKRLSKITILLSIAVITESLIAIFQFIKKGSLGGLFYFLGERTFNGQTPGISNASLDGSLVLRPYATFPHPNVLAGFLLITMIFFIYNLKRKDKNLVKILTPALLIGSIALLLSMSRIAIFLWMVILAIFVYKSFKKARYLFFNLIMLSFLIAGVFFTPIGSRFLHIDLSDPVFANRFDLIRQSIMLIVQNPIFGVGLNNSILTPSATSLRENIFYPQPVHNIYLLIGLESGLPGLLLFFLFIAKTYQKLKSKAHDPRYIALSCILILGFFDHYFLTLQQGQLLFSFILGLCWAKKTLLIYNK